MVLATSMGRYKLDVRTGDRNTLPYYTGRLAPAVLQNADQRGACNAGRVMSLNTAGFLVPGILAAAGANGGPIPFFAWSGLDINNAPDSQRDRGMPGYLDLPAGGVGGPGSPGFYGIPVGSELAGAFTTIQHNHPGELSTTEFDQGVNALPLYTPGAALTAVSATSGTVAIRGVIRPVGAATDVIVGWVAPAGVFDGADGYPTLAFIPAYVPGSTVVTALVA